VLLGVLGRGNLTNGGVRKKRGGDGVVHWLYRGQWGMVDKGVAGYFFGG